jgi:very-short-patch-repair endonuclease
MTQKQWLLGEGYVPMTVENRGGGGNPPALFSRRFSFGEAGALKARLMRSFSRCRDGVRRPVRLLVMKHSSPLTYARAKRMRREPTDAERRLWGALRGRRLGGFKFYRQMPIGPYIVDFINQEFGLVVEVDGVTHGEDREVAHDARRTAFLESKGLLTHRVDSMAVYQHLGAVLDGIHAVLSERAAKGPHPSRALRDPPSPKGKGG